ncbi:hypothetical protein PQQ53_21390 [Paraburkholderia strydomiana]|uniref:hypothetical protein n=1 Tax=Paraburkholderia strydomiana TaxID=1245417 RepID=UPI0038BCACE7
MTTKQTLTAGQAAMLEKLRALDFDPDMPIVDRTTPCLPWKGASFSDGYPMGWRNGSTRRMTREIYAMSRCVPTEALDGLIIRHFVCDNPNCHEFTHLAAGTTTDNMADRDNAGHTAIGERHGLAVLTADLVRTIRAMYVPRSRTHSAKAIANTLGFSRSTVRDVLIGRTWSHVDAGAA